MTSLNSQRFAQGHFKKLQNQTEPAAFQLKDKLIRQKKKNDN